MFVEQPYRQPHRLISQIEVFIGEHPALEDQRRGSGRPQVPAKTDCRSTTEYEIPVFLFVETESQPASEVIILLAPGRNGVSDSKRCRIFKEEAAGKTKVDCADREVESFGQSHAEFGREIEDLVGETDEREQRHASHDRSVVGNTVRDRRKEQPGVGEEAGALFERPSGRSQNQARVVGIDQGIPAVMGARTVDVVPARLILRIDAAAPEYDDCNDGCDTCWLVR